MIRPTTMVLWCWWWWWWWFGYFLSVLYRYLLCIMARYRIYGVS